MSTPKQGQFFQHKKDREIYVVSRITADTWCLIDISSGNRWNDPVEYPGGDVFTGARADFKAFRSADLTKLVNGG